MRLGVEKQCQINWHFSNKGANKSTSRFNCGLHRLEFITATQMYFGYKVAVIDYPCSQMPPCDKKLEIQRGLEIAACERLCLSCWMGPTMEWLQRPSVWGCQNVLFAPILSLVATAKTIAGWTMANFW